MTSGRSSRVVPIPAPLLTALTGVGALAGALVLSAPPLVELQSRVAHGEQWNTLPFGLLLTCLAAGVLAGCGLWLAAVTVGIVVEVLTGSSSALIRALTPAVIRRVVLVCCGLAVGCSGAVSPATADPPSHTEKAAGMAARGMGTALTGLPLPDRAVGGAAPALGHRTSPAPAQWRVRRGESLWSIAEELLPTGARSAELDAAWRRIYRTNRSAIGTDPDLLVPGTTLRLPDPISPQASDHPRPARPGPEPTTPRKDAS